jgi:hypothetical protein
MESGLRKVLIVAHRTAAAPALLAKVEELARERETAFTLVVPRLSAHAERGAEEAEKTLELAVPALEEAAGGRVEAIIGDSDPFVAVREALKAGGFDEVVVSTLPQRVSHWLRRDLPSRVRELGVPVTTVTAPQARRRVLTEAVPHGYGA